LSKLNRVGEAVEEYIFVLDKDPLNGKVLNLLKLLNDIDE